MTVCYYIMTYSHMKVSEYILLQSVAFRMSAVIIPPLDAGGVAAPQGGMPFENLSNWS